MITLYRWSAAQNSGQWLDVELLRTAPDELRATTDVLWIDLDHPSEEEERLVFEKFYPIHPLSLEDITRLRREPESPHFPKVEEYPDYLFVIANPLKEHLLGRLMKRSLEEVLTEGRISTQLSAVLTKSILITHSYGPMPSVQELRSHLSKHHDRAGRGPDYLFHLVLDAMVDQYAMILDRFSEALDVIEMQVFEQPSQRLLLSLLQYKQGVLSLRKTLVYEREVLARMSRGEFSLIAERETAYYRNVYDHLVRFTELTENAREMVSDLMQTYLSAASHKLNEIIKVLTMISTVVLPMSLIAGIYGMNFHHQPEYHWDHGYPFALGLMFLTGLVSFVLFRWRKWI